MFFPDFLQAIYPGHTGRGHLIRGSFTSPGETKPDLTQTFSKAQRIASPNLDNILAEWHRSHRAGVASAPHTLIVSS